MTELKLPSLGEGIEKGTVISIMVKVGDTIAAEQALMEVETDKVVVEVPSDVEGVVTGILVNLGDEISEGTPIIQLEDTPSMTINEPETLEVKAPLESSVVVEKEPEVKTEATTVTTQTVMDLKLPSLGEGIEKGSIIAIHIKEGEVIVAEQTLMEVETDKVVVEVPADVGGTISKVLVKIGDEVSEGDSILSIKVNKSEGIETEQKEEEKPLETPIKKPIEKDIAPSAIKIINPQPSESNRKTKFRASPLAKKMAREIGIDITSMSLSNGRKRISLQDVKDYAKALNENRETNVTNISSPTLPDLSKWGTIRKESMSGIMQATSKNMTTSWSHIPHAWLQEKVDITYLEQQRQKHKNKIKEAGGSLTITGILVKAVTKALEDFPVFNASIDVSDNQLIFKDYINIGIAVDTDRGLLVPVLKNADKKSITDIAFELGDLANKVKQKKITVEELDGGTFTISNLGGIGTTAIFPLVTFPQVAILGVASSQTEATWINGQFQPRLIMPLTIGFDHRIINGADAARFMKHLKNLLEDWFMWNI